MADRSKRGPGSRDLSGSVLDGRYRIIAPLGVGGMGTVYEGVQITLDKPVAIKVLKPELADDAAYVERFFREAKAASRVGHRNVVHTMDFGRVPSGPAYYVMELLRGIDLSQLIKRTGRLPWRRTRHIILQVLAALEAAHAEGVIHRDVKPANIFLLSDRDDHDDETGDFVKVLDFGIAKLLDSSDLTRADEIVGTASYMAPEQAHGIVDERSDAYSVGVLMYKMLTGATPFRGANGFEIMSKHQSEPPPPLRPLVPGLSAAVEALVLQALAKRPELRFQSMTEMRAAVRAISASATGRRAPVTVGDASSGMNTPTQVRAVGPVSEDGSTAQRPAEPGGTVVAASPMAPFETERVPEIPPPNAPLDAPGWMPEPTGPSGAGTFSSVFADTTTTSHALAQRTRLLKGVTVGLVLAALTATTVVLVSLQSEPDPPPAPSRAPKTAAPVTSPAPSPAASGVEPTLPATDPAAEATDGPADEPPDEAPAEVPGEVVDASTGGGEEPELTMTAPPRDPSPKARPAVTDDSVKRRLVRRARVRCADLGAGRVEVRFSIRSDGGVMLVDAMAPHVDDALGRCVEGVVSGARFPKGDLRQDGISVSW